MQSVLHQIEHLVEFDHEHHEQDEDEIDQCLENNQIQEQNSDSSSDTEEEILAVVRKPSLVVVLSAEYEEELQYPKQHSPVGNQTPTFDEEVE